MKNLVKIIDSIGEFGGMICWIILFVWNWHFGLLAFFIVWGNNIMIRKNFNLWK